MGVLGFAAAPAKAASGGWTPVQALGTDLHDVTMLPGTAHGWAVGAGGVVIETFDGGATWRFSGPTGTTATLRGVDFVDADHGWVVGDVDTILLTADGGRTWTRSATNLAGQIDAVEFVDHNRGWVAGSGLTGQIFTTADGGRTWTVQLAASPALGMVDVSFLDARRGVAVGHLGAVYRTDDAGATWVPTPVPSLPFEGFYAAERLDGDVLVVAGLTGTVVRSADAGKTWTTVTTLPAKVTALASSGATLLAVGDTGLIGRSDDGGVTWAQQAAGTTSDLGGVTLASPSAALTAGTFGFVSRYAASETQAIPPVALALSPPDESCRTLERTWRHSGPGAPVASIARDLDGDGHDEAIVGGPAGVRALDLAAATERSILWETPVRARVQQILAAQLDADAPAELLVGTAATSTSADGVLALDAADGTVLWSARVAGGAREIAAGDSDGDGVAELVVRGDTAQLTYLSGRDGSRRREPSPLRGRATDIELDDLDGDGRSEVVVTTDEGRASVIDPSTGITKWTYTTAYLGALALADLTGDGHDDVVVGGYGEPVAATRGYDGGATTIGTRSGALVAALDGRTGARIWDFAVPGQNRVAALELGRLNADAVPDVVIHESGIDRGFLLALDGRGQTVAGTPTGEPQQLWNFETTRAGESQAVQTPDAIRLRDVTGDGAQDALLAVDNGVVFAVDGSPVQAAGGSTEVPAARELWRDSHGGSFQRVPLLLRSGPDTELLTISSDGFAAVRHPGTGDIRHRLDAGGTPTAVLLDADADAADEIAVGTAAGRVYALDANGALLTARDVFLPDPVIAVAGLDIDGDGRSEIIAAARDGSVQAIDPHSGAVRWSRATGQRPTALAAGAGVVTVGTATGRVLGLEAATGDPSWDSPLHAGTMVRDIEFLRRRGLFATGASADGAVGILSPAGDVVATGAAGESISDIVSVDADGDGQEEIAVGSGVTVQTFAVDGTRLGRASIGSLSARVGAADLDGDGRDEIIAIGLGDQALALTGAATSVLWKRTVAGATALGAVDLDGNGSDEALFAGEGRTEAFDRSGTSRADCDLARDPVVVLPADVDGDGATEIALAMDQGDVSALSVPARGAGGGDPTPTPTPTPTATPVAQVRGTYPITPNDPYFGDGSKEIGDPTQWAPRKISAPQAWQEQRGTGLGIKVAVIDSGVDLEHPDLRCPGKLIVPTDGDVVDNGNGPDDQNGHGTHVAGIIAACTDNGKGVAGIAPDASILPYQVFDETGSGSVETIDYSIRAAADAGAHVINMSLSIGFGFTGGAVSGYFIDDLDQAIEYARSKGVVVVAAAGNDALLPLCAYPALAADVVCVGATDPRDVRTRYTNFPAKTDENGDPGPSLVAPGGTGSSLFCDLHSEEILSLFALDLDESACDRLELGYADLAGTSMATPHVAGVAALVYDRLGGERSAAAADTVMAALTSTATDLGVPGWDPVFGSGRVDAARAVSETPLPRWTLSTSTTGEGAVTSDPAGIDCGTTCSATFDDAQRVVLTATPATGWRFAGWEGACSGSQPSCEITMDQSRDARARFERVRHPLTVTRSGEGTVISEPAGIDCGSVCARDYDHGTRVTLQATPRRGWKFAGWSGACSGTGACVLDMTAARAVTATFRRGGKG